MSNIITNFQNDPKWRRFVHNPGSLKAIEEAIAKGDEANAERMILHFLTNPGMVAAIKQEPVGVKPVTENVIKETPKDEKPIDEDPEVVEPMNENPEPQEPMNEIPEVETENPMVNEEVIEAPAEHPTEEAPVEETTAPKKKGRKSTKTAE